MKKSMVYTRTGDKGTTSLVGGRRVSKTDIRLESYGTVDDRVEHDVATVEAHVLINGVGRLVAVGVHRHQDSLDGEVRIHVGLHDADRVQQLAEAFQGEILALHGNDDRIGSHQGVEGHQAE